MESGAITLRQRRPGPRRSRRRDLRYGENTAGFELPVVSSQRRFAGPMESSGSVPSLEGGHRVLLQLRLFQVIDFNQADAGIGVIPVQDRATTQITVGARKLVTEKALE